MAQRTTLYLPILLTLSALIGQAGSKPSHASASRLASLDLGYPNVFRHFLAIDDHVPRQLSKLSKLSTLAPRSPVVESFESVHELISLVETSESWLKSQESNPDLAEVDLLPQWSDMDLGSAGWSFGISASNAGTGQRMTTAKVVTRMMAKRALNEKLKPAFAFLGRLPQSSQIRAEQFSKPLIAAWAASPFAWERAIVFAKNLNCNGQLINPIFKSECQSVKLTFETSLRNAFEKNSQRIQDIATAVRLYTEYSDSIIVKFLESFDIYLRMGRVEISTSTLSTLWRGVLPPELELDFASDQALEKLRVLAQIPIPRDLDYARTRIATMNVLLMDNAIKEGLPHLTTKRYTRSVYATAESLLSDLLNREIESQIGILENILIEPEKQLENLKTEGVGS